MGTRNATVCVLSYSAMRVPLILAIARIGFTCTATSQDTVVHERRQRAVAAFRDGILLFHASSELDLTADGFRQEPFFYYFTGLGNTVGAVLGREIRRKLAILALQTTVLENRSTAYSADEIEAAVG